MQDMHSRSHASLIWKKQYLQKNMLKQDKKKRKKAKLKNWYQQSYTSFVYAY